MEAPQPNDEAARLQALRQYQTLIDTTPQETFDGITRLAALICKAPIALINVIDLDHQWFKLKSDLNAKGFSNNIAFCSHTILQRDLLIVPDALVDHRFAENPLVTSPPHVRFYAGVPLLTPEGLSLGILSVFDHQPRKLRSEQMDGLKTLARQVM